MWPSRVDFTYPVPIHNLYCVERASFPIGWPDTCMSEQEFLCFSRSDGQTHACYASRMSRHMLGMLLGCPDYLVQTRAMLLGWPDTCYASRMARHMLHMLLGWPDTCYSDGHADTCYSDGRTHATYASRMWPDTCYSDGRTHATYASRLARHMLLGWPDTCYASRMARPMLWFSEICMFKPEFIVILGKIMRLGGGGFLNPPLPWRLLRWNSPEYRQQRSTLPSQPH
jgi:hypothetical protein